MKPPYWIEKTVLRSVEAIFARVPQPMPSRRQLTDVKIIAHRGENHLAIENTLDAFRLAIEGGAWGLEFDIRWCQDGEPVIHHDLTTQRVFGSSIHLSQITRHELRKRHAEIPWPEEVLSEFGGHHHLLLELKLTRYIGLSRQLDCLQRLLTSLVPVRDYHIISVHPELLNAAQKIFPSRALLPVASTNARFLSHLIEENDWGGLLAFFPFCPTHVIVSNVKKGRVMGTGFIDSQNVLKRELNRDVNWLFSNRAGLIRNILNRLRGFEGT